MISSADDPIASTCCATGPPPAAGDLLALSKKPKIGEAPSAPLEATTTSFTFNEFVTLTDANRSLAPELLSLEAL